MNHFNAEYVFKSFTPVGLVELLGGIDNVVAVVLGS